MVKSNEERLCVGEPRRGGRWNDPGEPANSLTPATSNRLPAAAVLTLDTYAETVLTCPPRLARSGGVHLLSASGRGLPSWHGYTLPIVGLSFAPGAVVACRPDLVDRLRAELDSDLHQTYLDGPAFRRLWHAVQRCVPN